ncbi:MAG: hypothetical protein JWN57_1552 [Frankiales bacterium]|nr:hypothetical protein [Frankiales bacterium]
MAELRCGDGRRVGVLPVPVLDRDGVAYEVTLSLALDDVPFGAVGERCGYFVAAAAARLRAARQAGDAFPASSLEAGLRAWAEDDDADPDAVWRVLQRYVPRDRELFCFRARDPDDIAAAGQIRACVEQVHRWQHGRWSRRSQAVVDVWGDRGHGVRAVLDSDELLAFLESLVRDCAAVGVRYDDSDDGSVLRRPAG